MNYRIFISLLIFLFIQLEAFSQTSLTGKVTDSLNNPLAGANLIAEPRDSLKQLKFAITGDDGKFSLQLENIYYTVTASFMGFEPFSFEIKPSTNMSKDIVLNPKAEGLEEVLIEMPVVVKEDTIVYNVDKLVTGEERKLKDILKKLPGVEVDRDGTIRVRGKEVTVMLVENKKFFGGGSKLAAENIPADAIDQIEVLDNYNEVAFLQNVSDSKEMAMNVKLKEDKKNFAFGDVEAGKGNKDFYRTHGNLFYYSSKTNLNVIGNLNNIREQILTYEQYFDFKGGLNSVFNQGSTDLNYSNIDFTQFLESQDVVKSRRQFGALNISQEVNNKLDISAYGLFSKTNEKTFVEAINRYNSFSEISENSSAIDNVIGIGNIQAVYLPNLTDQWYFKSLFKRTDNKYKKRINSVVDSLNNTFLTNEDVRGSFFNQSIEWHRKSSKEHTFSAAVNYTFEERLPEILWETSDPILQGLVPIVEQPVYLINQKKRVKNNQFNAFFKHYWVLNKNHHIYTTLGNTYLNNKFQTHEYQNLDDGSFNDFSNDNFGNDLDFTLNDLFLGLHYKFQFGIFSFDQGAYLHQYSWKVSQADLVTKNKILILPSLRAEAKLSQTKDFEFEYQLKSLFSDAPQFASRYYLRTYNSVAQGNENIENGLSHNFKFRFNKFSTYRGFQYYAVANYTHQVQGVVNSVNYEGINQSKIPILLQDPETRWSIYGRLSKKISEIDFRGGTRYNASRYKQIVNSNLVENTNTNFSYNISGKTLFDNFPIIELGFRQIFGSYKLSGRKSKFITNEPFLNVDYDFWKGFIFSFDYTAYRYKNKDLNLSNNYEIANTSLYYNKGNSAWSFEVEAQNLFDVEFISRNSFSSYIISDNRTYILPRIIMFTIGYKL